jgi:hypothetical protein
LQLQKQNSFKHAASLRWEKPVDCGSAAEAPERNNTIDNGISMNIYEYL